MTSLLSSSCLLIVAAAALMPSRAASAKPATSATPAMSVFDATIRIAACKPIQADFDRIISTHHADPEVRATLQRLTIIDGVATAVLRDLQLDRSTFLDQSLATVRDVAPAPDATAQPLGASGIVQRYGSAFTPITRSAALDPADQLALQAYLRTSTAALTAYLDSKARACLPLVGMDAAEVVRLSFVLDMLSRDPNADPGAAPPELPSWLSNLTSIRLLETFALDSSRPRIAFAIAQSLAPIKVDNPRSLYLSFIQQQAEVRQRAGKYAAAAACLRDAISVSRSMNRDTQAIDLSFQLATVLQIMNSSRAAAQEMANLRSICPKDTDFTRASILRLKYLHAAGDDETLFAEANADLAEPRCKLGLPQIVYIAWAAAREHGHGSDPWRSEFLQRFPDHPLAVQLYFASAIDALAATNYPQASKMLALIQDRFPRCAMIDKVHALQHRLQSMSPIADDLQPGVGNHAQ